MWTALLAPAWCGPCRSDGGPSSVVGCARVEPHRIAPSRCSVAATGAGDGNIPKRRLTDLQRSAINARISQLERDIEEREADITRIKGQLGRAGRRRAGWQGEFSRFSESEAAKLGKATE
eukprot:7017481-Prymnesium_polylepis.1